MYMAAWTKDRVETLVTLLKEGNSAQEIATALGDTTRSAVMGKAHRIGLNFSEGVGGMVRPHAEPPEIDSHTRNMMASRALLLRLQRLHYDQSPKAFKDKHLPVLYVESEKPVIATLADAPAFSMDGFDAPGARPLHTVLAAVSHYYRIPKWKIIGTRKTADVVRPRQVAMYLAVDFSEMSLKQVSRHFNRDHTVIGYAREQITKKMASDAVLAIQVETLKKQIAAMDNIPSIDHVARLRDASSRRNRPDLYRVSP